MKKVIVLALLFASTHLFAQNEIKEETLFGKGKSKPTITAYGALSNTYSRIDGQAAVFTGAYGGVLFNHKFFLGLGGYGLVTDHHGFDSEGNMDRSNEIKMGYGGIVVGYTFMSEKRIHATTSLLIGAGAAVNGYHKDYPDSHGDHFRSLDESDFSVLEPTVSVEANMTNWFRISLGAGYRFVRGVEMAGLCDSKLSAPTMNLSLKFGKF